ncbi:hypothetical protein [Dyella sp.]|uniref:hypothetical protein n=1 Tax=Dyella sp. TaxID=1869338 RepID=UPI002ED66E2A
MSSRLPQHSLITVAIAGLGMLSETRLRVACSLLMAERMRVDVVNWGAAQAHILVADHHSAEGNQAIESAHRLKLPTLALGRTRVASLMTLSPSATVKDIAEALKQLIQRLGADTSAMPEVNLPPLLEALRLDRPNDGGLYLYELGLIRMVVDYERRYLHMLRRVAFDHLLRDLDNAYWHSTPLDAHWLAQHRMDVHASFSIESVWWQLLAMPHIQLPIEWLGNAVQLNAWPDLDTLAVDPSTIQALTHLMHGSWQAQALVEATGIDGARAGRILAIAQASGLADQVTMIQTVKPASGASPGIKGAILKIAKRFGLQLRGLRHA